MKLVFIRHGDPDYAHDRLTEKGKKEAQLLVKRLENTSVRDFYCSPLGRARETAAPTLTCLAREATILDWLEEFNAPILDPDTGKSRIPWDLMPGYWTKQQSLYSKDHWFETEIMQTGNVKKAYDRVAAGIDDLLKTYGYVRKDMIYTTEKGNEDTIVFFCHLGVQFIILSYLLGIAPSVFLQGFFVAPSSVTVVATEERKKGEVYFRCKTIGDTSHLYIAGEPLSDMGFFSEIYREV